MNINRSNYEIYFLDYLDGNLPDDQIDDFLDFLHANPDLHQELKKVSALNRMEPPATIFPTKSKLMKNELTGSSNFDYKAVALLENDLSGGDEKSFVREISNDEEKENDFDLFLKTKLQPDKTILFKDKQALYRKSNSKLILLWGSRVAAALVLLFAVWAILKSPSGQPNSTPIVERKVPMLKQTVPIEEQQNIEANPVSQKEAKKASVKERLEQPVQIQQKLHPSIAAAPTPNNLMAVREKAPDRLKSLQSSIENKVRLQNLGLVGMEEYQLDEQEYITIDEYLAEKILKKNRNEPLTFKHILSAGLDAVASASNERVDYETTREGKVSEISLNTRLFAFSIPLKKNK